VYPPLYTPFFPSECNDSARLPRSSLRRRFKIRLQVSVSYILCRRPDIPATSLFHTFHVYYCCHGGLHGCVESGSAIGKDFGFPLQFPFFPFLKSATLTLESLQTELVLPPPSREISQPPYFLIYYILFLPPVPFNYTPPFLSLPDLSCKGLSVRPGPDPKYD